MCQRNKETVGGYQHECQRHPQLPPRTGTYSGSGYHAHHHGCEHIYHRNESDECRRCSVVFHYLGSERHYRRHLYALLDEHEKCEKDQSFAVFPTDSALVLSRVFGETIYELSLKDREKYLSLKEKAKKNHNKKDFIKANKILRFYEYCTNFTDTVLKTAFKTIDNLLANEND